MYFINFFFLINFLNKFYKTTLIYFKHAIICILLFFIISGIPPLSMFFFKLYVFFEYIQNIGIYNIFIFFFFNTTLLYFYFINFKNIFFSKNIIFLKKPNFKILFYNFVYYNFIFNTFFFTYIEFCLLTL